MPSVGVVGIAGEVNNNTVRTTNCPHWPVSDGVQVSAEFKMQSFTFINDFAAAGYGICMLTPTDYVHLNRAVEVEGGVKVVMGPGTGHGQGFLTKSVFSKCYEIWSSEGGHVDFAVTSEEDWKLRQFAMDFIKNSENIENLRGKGEITRTSVERFCAGPAVPLIYEFMKTQYPDLPRILEQEKKPDELISGDIISAGLEKKDELCMKVVKKFTEILAVEVGNMALKTLPYGGIYLVGGVTGAILNYLETDNFFLHTVHQKGRLSSVVRRIPIYAIKPEVELGILGAEECAFRNLGNFGI